MRSPLKRWAFFALAVGVVLPAPVIAETPTLAEMKAQYKRPEATPFPADDPFSAEKAELGRMLFFDPRVSGANYISCATCHNPSLSWGDGMAHGHGMSPLGRRTPTILNAAWGDIFMWDGRLPTLEKQALGPMGAPGEMGADIDGLPAKLAAIRGYRVSFQRAFPGQEVSLDTITKAIATFERTIVSGTAPFDQWISGDESAISEPAKHGFVLFNTTGNCAACHSGWNFTDGGFHDIGLLDADPGRGAILNLLSQQHAFKTPTLRDVARRGPFMHDGSMATLEDVVAHYAKGGVQRASLAPEMHPLDLSEADAADLVAFLKTLTGDDAPIVVPVLPAGPETAER
jgi:cytochrome c peroxidase